MSSISCMGRPEVDIAAMYEIMITSLFHKFVAILTAGCEGSHLKIGLFGGLIEKKTKRKDIPYCFSSLSQRLCSTNNPCLLRVDRAGLHHISAKASAEYKSDHHSTGLYVPMSSTASLLTNHRVKSCLPSE